ncbi:hypothetical protein BDF14DRAFT_789970 [Spinellus fusiger]|nr:hypothetical protein BDF14DRAFT_789970 [Spinellus fusiger]
MPDPPMKKDASHPFSNSIPPTSPILTSPSTALVSSHSTKVAMDLPTQADTQADKKNPTDLGSMHIDIPSAPDPQKSRLSIASFSLTHHQDAIKTYRRMAAKTRDKNVQMTYCHYLFEIAALYPVDTRTNTTRHRLLTEAGYWIETLAKGGHPEALLIKGQWYQEGPQAQQCVGMGYTKVQPQKALRCYQQSAKAGNIEAYYRLGNHWKSQNMKERASTHYAWAAARGHVHANYVSLIIELNKTSPCIFTPNSMQWWSIDKGY